LAGFGIGVVQSLLTKAAIDFSWLPQIGLQDGVPFVLVIIVMAVGGRLLPGRGALTRIRYPVAYAPRNLTRRFVVLSSIAVVAVLVLHGQARFALIASMIGVLLALSIVILTGYTGLISLAQFAFAGIAAFMVSKLASGAGIPFPIAPAIAV